MMKKSVGFIARDVWFGLGKSKLTVLSAVKQA